MPDDGADPRGVLKDVREQFETLVLAFVDLTLQALPAMVGRDKTEVVECVPGTPPGTRSETPGPRRVHRDIRPGRHPEGSQLTIEERVVRGVLSIGPIRRVVEVAIDLRNLELCRRFRKLIEQREKSLADLS